MKNLQIVAYQSIGATNQHLPIVPLELRASPIGDGTTQFSDETAVSTSIKLDVEFRAEINPRMLAGTACNELFHWVKLQRAVGAKGLKLSEPINLRISIDGQTIDTGIWKKELRAKMKLQNSPEGRRNFALKFWAIMEETLRPIEAKDIYTLHAETAEEAGKVIQARIERRLLAAAAKEAATATN